MWAPTWYLKENASVSVLFYVNKMAAMNIDQAYPMYGTHLRSLDIEMLILAVNGGKEELTKLEEGVGTNRECRPVVC